MPKDFRTLFHNVFDENEEVRLCGREACKALNGRCLPRRILW